MTDFSTEELANLDGTHRYGFPGYRVFIFGHEVTEDVIDVRVNHSGGSADRSPGSCSITLGNKNNKYIISNTDMKAIAVARQKLKANIDKKLKDTQDDSFRAIQSVIKENEDQIARIKAENPDSFIDNGLYDQEYARLLDEFSSQGVSNVENKEYQEFPLQWFSESIDETVKKSVINKKMKWKAAVKPSKNVIFTKFEYELFYKYPYQQADCVFHSNDPVRIVFQDPFDSRQKWWMFAGFIDSKTNTTGLNNNSNITLSCTDVSKLPRYALIQLNTGLLDDDIKKILNIDEGISSAGVQAYKELFADFTVIEALETLFFGSRSLLDKYEKFHDKTAAFVASMSPEELRVYLLENTGMKTIDVDDMIYGGKIKEQGPDEWATLLSASERGLAEARNKVMSLRYEDIVNKLYNTRIDEIQTHDGVGFTRKNSEIGINAYFVGTPNNDDRLFGEEIKDLEWWNDLINHRVRLEDIRDMAVKEGKSIKYGTSIDDVITEIGTNLEEYPVGGGKVYYLAPARLGEYLDRSVIDRTPTSSVEFHSEFKDKLSYIYSMAETIDFRFYATPRGDVVFEMPFYDFDVDDFVVKKDISNNEIKKFDYIERYENIFGKAYQGKYDADVAQALTEMTLKANLYSLDRDIVDYDLPPEINYRDIFTIEDHERKTYSNTSTDDGIMTMYGAIPNLIRSMEGLNSASTSLNRYIWSYNKELIPHLGVRVMTGNTWTFLKGPAETQAFCALTLNRTNAEARNCSVNITPKFGLMVNRPIFWRENNYMACVASVQHSIVWNSSISTTVNINQIRGWSGEVDDHSGKPKYRHFGDTGRSFNLAEFLKQNNKGKK